MNASTTSASQLFVSPKCRGGAIRVAHPNIMRALIAATLDADVTSIECLPAGSAPPGCGDVIVVEHEDFRSVLEVGGIEAGVQKVRADAWRALGLLPLRIATENLQDPRYANAERIWKHRQATVPTTVRLQVLQILDHGRTTLDDLLKKLRHETDPLPAVFAMACNADIAIELDATLGLTTNVWSQV